MRHRRDERGAVAVFTAFVLVILLGVAAFVVDIGMQRVVRTDMQSVADVVALDLSRELDGRTADQLASVMQAQQELSLNRNTSSLGDRPELTITLGQVDDLGNFTQVAGATVPNAVRVEAAGAVAFAFSGVTGVTEGDATRNAIASASSGACFRLGSYAAALKTGDSAVAAVFESMMFDALGVNLKAIGYMGLANAYVDLGMLATELGVGTVDALVGSSSVNVKSLLFASAAVLDRQGDTQASAAMGSIAAKVTSTLQMSVADILTIGDGSAISSSINALDLLGSAGFSAAAVVANGNNFLDTGVLWSDPWLSKGDVKLTVIDPPQQACGSPQSRPTARTSQVELDTNLSFEVGDKIAGLNAVTRNGEAKAIIRALATVAGATGTLTGMACGDATASDPEEFRVRVDSQPMSASITVPFRLTGTISGDGIVPRSLAESLLSATELLTGIASVTVTLGVNVEAGSEFGTAAVTGSGDTVYSVPPLAYGDPQPSVNSGQPVSIPAATDATLDVSTMTATVRIDLLGNRLPDKVVTLDAAQIGQLTLEPIRSAVLGTTNRVNTSLANVVMNVNTALVPVAKLLGLSVGGSDVFGVPRPACGLPRLVG